MISRQMVFIRDSAETLDTGHSPQATTPVPDDAVIAPRVFLMTAVIGVMYHTIIRVHL